MSVIFIGESVRRVRNQTVEQACKNINGRAPLRKEEGIDYEIDTEDQLEEEEAEDLNGEEEEDEEDEGDEAGSFMVPDGYLSGDEQSEKDSNYIKFYYFIILFQILYVIIHKCHVITITNLPLSLSYPLNLMMNSYQNNIK